MVEGQEAHHGQVAPAVVVAVEEGELLLPVGGILRGVEVDGDVTGPTPEPLPVALNHDIRQGFSHPEKFSSTDRVLETRDSRLRSQSFPIDGVPSHQHLVDGILRQTRRIVPIGVATGDREDALREQFLDLMADPAGVAPVPQAPRQTLRQSQSQIDGFEQHRSSVGAAVVLVKPRDQGLPEKLGKQQTLCRAIVGQTGASFVRERSLSKPFLARWSSRSVHFFTNSPG